jgi:Fe-S cluster assembly protein SufB
VVPQGDNYFACLNSAVFTDGSFVFIPKGVRCPMELSTYFRINAKNTGQFERTLIIAEAGSHVSYLEGCTAPMRDENQLHAAVVELVAMDDATIKYSTGAELVSRRRRGQGRHLQLRHQARRLPRRALQDQLDAGRDRLGDHLEVSVLHPPRRRQRGRVLLGGDHQQPPAGRHRDQDVHVGRNTKSTIVSKGISAGRGQNTYRGLVKISPKASGARNFTQCDSLLIGDQCGAHTVPYIENRCMTAKTEHEATTSRIAEDQLFYCRARGLNEEEAVGLIVNGFCREVLKELPMEFAVEAQKLLQISLEGSVG